jgi:hypothetical protein
MIQQSAELTFHVEYHLGPYVQVRRRLGIARREVSSFSLCTFFPFFLFLFSFGSVLISFAPGLLC